MSEITASIDASSKRRGLMFVLSSPSGAGKTTLSRRLLARDTAISMSVSVTTRPMRKGEVQGVDYHFVTPHDFQTMRDAGDLLEHATVFENSYGTPRNFVMDKLASGEDVLFDIDWQGTQQLRASCPHDMVSVFILPPSMKELERRLRTRASDSEEVVAHRMARASDEISHWEEYDYVVTNDDLDRTLERIVHILEAERLHRSRQPWLRAHIEAL